MINSNDLTPADLDNLKRSFITPEVASQAGIRRVDTQAGAEYVKRTPSANEDYSGLIFPYRLPDELGIREYRLRRDNPDLEERDGKIKEKGKYLSPPGRSNMIYFPPCSRTEWLGDTALPIVIVEGEKKALALHRACWYLQPDSAVKPAFLPIGLGGVWNFRGNIGKTTNARGARQSVKGLIPDFQLINWQNRKVIILFDANTATNASVAKARRTLARELKNLGADVLFADLPEIGGCNGIDDFLGKIEEEAGVDEACKYLFKLLDRAIANDSTIVKASDFEVREDGVYAIDREGGETFICSPLHIIAETQTESGENYGRLLEWKDSKGRIHKWAMPMAYLYSDTNDHIKHFVSRGLRLSPNRKIRDKLTAYLALSEPIDTVICTDKIGWTSDNQNFVLPYETINGSIDSNESIIFQSEFLSEDSYQVNGTLEEWRENVAKLCAGNSRLIFAVSAAFAACMLPLMNEQGCGFHFRGASSLGKTTALLVAGSVWGGDDDRGFIETWRSTANGLEATAELHNHALLNLDEIKECDAKTIGQTAYMLANGSGKKRMGRNIRLRPQAKWNLLFLSSGELGLDDLIAQSGERSYGGQAVRLIDLEADAGECFGLFEDLHGFDSANAFADALRTASKKFYGTAIREFIAQILTVDHEKGKKHLEQQKERFFKEFVPKDANGEVLRVASKFAFIGFAGETAIHCKITGWETGEAWQACGKLFKGWLASRSGESSTDIELALRQIRHFLGTHGASRFQDSDSELATVSNRAGFKRINAVTGETEFLVFPEAFRLDVCKGFDAKIIARELAARNLLICDKGGFQKNERLPGLGQKKVYVISSRIFEEEVSTAQAFSNADVAEDATFINIQDDVPIF